MASNSCDVVVIHPDLGVGGAERLIVDASKALQDCGHRVSIYTGYHDKSRCFKETRDGTLKTFTKGQWIPRTIFGRCHALMAYLKMMYIAFYLILWSKHDLVLCDQVSACIPILKLDFRNRCKIVFYCHFPDQLLTQRATLIKRLYRFPIDWFEEWSTSLAHLILVNSNFTRNVVKTTFKSLRNRELKVLYPCVDIKEFVGRRFSLDKCSEVVRQFDKISRRKFLLLSLNRFERKKDLTIAIEALSIAVHKLASSKEDNNEAGRANNNNDDNDGRQTGDGGYKPTKEGQRSGTFADLHLIVAGGFDGRLRDSVLYYDELRQLTKRLDLESHVTFIESPSDEEKLVLLHLSHAVVYTPMNEHFGIVPLEAMAMLTPVIASATGGPLETIEHNYNGLLCDHDKESFAEAMLTLYNDHNLSAQMGANGFKRVKASFSYEAFRDNLNKICTSSK